MCFLLPFQFSPIVQDTVLKGTFNATLSNPIAPQMDMSSHVGSSVKHQFLLGVWMIVESSVRHQFLLGVWVTFRIFELTFNRNPVNEEIIKPILKRAKPDRDTKHYVSVLLLYKNLILFWRIFISIFTNCDELLYCDMIYTPDNFIVIHLCILMCVNHVIKCYICQSVCLSFISITYIQLHYMCSHSSSQVSVSVLKAMCAVRVRKSCLLRMLYTSITTP